MNRDHRSLSHPTIICFPLYFILISIKYIMSQIPTPIINTNIENIWAREARRQLDYQILYMGSSIVSLFNQLRVTLIH